MEHKVLLYVVRLQHHGKTIVVPGVLKETKESYGKLRKAKGPHRKLAKAKRS